MKILHITYTTKGGAGTAAERLFVAMQKYGMKVAFLSVNKTIDFEENEIKDLFFEYKKPTLFKKVLSKINAYCFPNKQSKLTRAYNKLKPHLNFEMASLPFSRFQLHKHPLVQQADLIHLHWVSGLLDYPTFFEHLDKPLVWTLHDMHPFLGLYHYQNDAIRNAHAVSKLDKEVLAIKTAAIQHLQNAAIVCPSHWMLSHARKSTVFSHFQSVCIPNTLDFNEFYSQNRNTLRKKYELDTEAFVLLLVADTLTSPRKGMDLLIEALEQLQTPLTLLSVGKGTLPRFKHHHLREFGKISTTKEMAEIYNLANTVILPSREDNLPNVMLEAIACGVPVIAFNSGGTLEHIHKEKTGILAEQMTSSELKNAISDLIKTKKGYPPEEIVIYAKEHFHKNRIVSQHIELYQNLKTTHNEKE